MGWVNVKDVANAQILAFEVPSASRRYCLVETVAHYSELVQLLHKLYPSFQLPENLVPWPVGGWRTEVRTEEPWTVVVVAASLGESERWRPKGRSERKRQKEERSEKLKTEKKRESGKVKLSGSLYYFNFIIIFIMPLKFYFLQLDTFNTFFWCPLPKWGPRHLPRLPPPLADLVHIQDLNSTIREFFKKIGCVCGAG
ncbi:hypothetical protein LguiB_032493 [Lonicera macranthoides]